MALGVTSATEGALLGLLLIGLLFPCIGKTGAITGAYSSLITMGLFVGKTQWYILKKRIHYPSLPTSVEGCSYPLNETLVHETTTESPLAPEDEPMILFRIAILYFTLMGAVIVIVVGAITSYFVGETDLSKVNPEHISPIIRRSVDFYHNWA